MARATGEKQSMKRRLGEGKEKNGWWRELGIEEGFEWERKRRGG